jgi:aldose 1-epimerase
MFKAQKEKFEEFVRLVLQNTQTGEHVSIIPQFGANVNELVLSKGNGKFSIIDGNGSYSSLIRNVWFKSAKLFPFPNRTNGGMYTFKGKQQQLPINFPTQQHAIHGLVYNRPFRIKKLFSRVRSVSVDLEYQYQGDIPGYPFSYAMIIRYSLAKTGFSCRTRVKNTGTGKMPVGDGWHPYFRVKGRVDNLRLQLPSGKKIAVNKRMIPTGKRREYSCYSSLRKLGTQRFDMGFALPCRKGKAVTRIYDGQADVCINLWQETGRGKYNYQQVFIPPHRRSIAIEPMTCMTDGFNNKQGLLVLDPGSVFEACYGVFLS